MTDLLDAPASSQREPAPIESQSGALLATVLPAGVVIVIALLSVLFDPRYDAIPLISGHARGYYLAALTILGLVTAFEVVRHTMPSPAIPASAASWGMIVSASTLALVDDPQLLTGLALVVLAVADGWVREGLRPGSQALAGWIGRIVAIALMWLALAGLLEFHLRWLYAFPLGAAIGSVAYARFVAAAEHITASHAPTAAVLGLVTTQLILAVSFLNVGASTGASVVALALASVYLAGHVELTGRLE